MKISMRKISRMRKLMKRLHNVGARMFFETSGSIATVTDISRDGEVLNISYTMCVPRYIPTISVTLDLAKGNK